MKSGDILHIGCQIDLPTDEGVRRCEVVTIDDAGFGVKFYTPEGVGPFYCTLPHGSFPTNTIHRRMYQDEAAGQHSSYFKTHPDFKA